MGQVDPDNGDLHNQRMDKWNSTVQQMVSVLPVNTRVSTMFIHFYLRLHNTAYMNSLGVQAQVRYVPYFMLILGWTSGSTENLQACRLQALGAKQNKS